MIYFFIAKLDGTFRPTMEDWQSQEFLEYFNDIPQELVTKGHALFKVNFFLMYMVADIKLRFLMNWKKIYAMC